MINSCSGFTGQAFQQCGKFVGKWGLNIHFTTGYGVRETQPLRVQEQAPQAQPLQPPVEFVVAVLVVTGNRVADMCRVHPRLMGASGQEHDLHERGAVEE